MTLEPNYSNNPLHGLSLKNMLIEMVDHYGFEILYAYLNINCFNQNASVESSIKFLKKTDWAREKVEAFYMYQLKGLPRCSNEQFELPPRDRIVSEEDAQQGADNGPAELSLEDAERLKEKRARKAAERNSRNSNNRGYGSRGGNSERRSSPWAQSGSSGSSASGDDNPWKNSPGFKG